VFGSIRLGSILGIPIRAHVLFLALVAFLVFTPGVGTAEVASLALLAAVLVLHELGHSLVARRFGIHVVDITLWPLGGMARLSHVPESSKAEGLIAVAGPAVNFVLAAAGFPLWLGMLAALGPEALASRLGLYFVGINVVMGAFNLIPAFPTDGGRILRALLALSRDWVAATEGAVRVGRAMSVLLFAAGVAFGNWMLPVLALWLWWTGSQELEMVRQRHQRASALDALARAARAGPGFEPPPARPAGFDERDVERLERFHGPLRQFDAER
jgi:Zn-dependent protease